MASFDKQKRQNYVSLWHSILHSHQINLILVAYQRRSFYCQRSLYKIIMIVAETSILRLVQSSNLDSANLSFFISIHIDNSSLLYLFLLINASCDFCIISIWYSSFNIVSLTILTCLFIAIRSKHQLRISPNSLLFLKF